MSESYNCSVCKDMRFVYLPAAPNSGDVGKAVPCECQNGVNAEKQRRHLLTIDGLSPAERATRFENLLVVPSNQEAYNQVTGAVSAGRGMVTLTGEAGRGKTSLLIAAVNDARERNIAAVYLTVSDLLDYIKAAFNPDTAGRSVDERWELLTSVQVLALDELSRYNSTPWADERFWMLIDQRWRNMDRRLTILAMNGNLSALDRAIQSRLKDKRAVVVTLGGKDMREIKEDL